MRLLPSAVFAAALVASPLVPTGAGAGTIADRGSGSAPTARWSSTARPIPGKIWTMPGKERHEQVIKGFEPVFILRGDSPIGDIVLAQLHTTVEFVFPASAFLADPRLTRHPIGHESVNGIPTTEYAVDETTPQGHAEGTLWLSRDGIPMRARAPSPRPTAITRRSNGN